MADARRAPRARPAGTLRLGTSGFHYAWWRGRFYPRELPARLWFGHYAQHFDTVEINNSFYRLPPASTFALWREQAPPGFLYAVKFSRFGSHYRKLLGPEATIGLFLERAEELGPTMGPVLVQLPPRWKADPGRLRAFLEAAPKRHRWCVEVRDPSWLVEDVYRVLEDHGAAFCIHDRVERCPWRITADWTYLRYHGPQGARSGYREAFLRGHAAKIRAELAAGRDVYAYFNNDLDAHAIRDAKTLRRLVLAPQRARRSGATAAQRL